MKRATIYIITKSFPYGKGEQFLETEIKYWSKQDTFDVVLLPLNLTKSYRSLPNNIKLDKALLGIMPNIFEIFKCSFSMFMSPILYQEIKYLYRNPLGVIKFIVDLAIYKKSLKKIKYLLSNRNFTNDIFYTYWFRPTTHALEILKDKYKYKLITRVHGYDLYEERAFLGYMPLKRQMSNKLDKVFTVTQNAISYLSKVYYIDNNLIDISRLGVKDNSIHTKTSEKGNIHIVSCSILKHVKRIDKIIHAIRLLCIQNPDLNVSWTHIGSGKMMKKLQKYALKKFYGFKNLNYYFIGNLKNNDVFNFYRSNHVDVFVNASDSEGVPVSIMEAMSCHIPIIAPDIGGIRDQVNSTNGILLKKNFDLKELTLALEKYEFFKMPETRKNSYMMFKQKYDSRVNYAAFIQKVKNLYL